MTTHAASTGIWRALNKRSRNGQAIIIVALAFMTLIAFVGIAVDVALLFVRYSALRRAVDAAAIAAAQQIRENTDYATLQAVAEQFIKLQGGISPDTVIVETCETEIIDILTNPPVGFTGTTAVDAQNYLYQTIPPSELCRRDPQKLVRVSAQVNSQTTFLSLIGWNTVLLTASALSQTAVLDVALLIDTSASMANDTFNNEVDYTPYPNQEPLKNFLDFTGALPTQLGLKPYTDRADIGLDGPQNGTGLNTAGEPSIRYECWTSPQVAYAPGRRFRNAANYAWGGCCNDPTSQRNEDNNVVPDRKNLNTLELNTYLGMTFPRRGYLGDVATPGDPPQFETLASTPPMWRSPAVGYSIDYYVSDPGTGEEALINKTIIGSGEPDGNYSDLICRPFKSVRDAARRFIKRLDFVRGDRLFLVTFNAQVNTIIPAGQSIPVISNKDTAIRTLNERVGVSVLPTGTQRECISQETYRGVNLGVAVSGEDKKYLTYWTESQCTDTNMGGGVRAGRAALTNPNWIRRDSVWVMVMLSDGFPNRTPSYSDLNAEFGINGADQNWLTVPSVDQTPPPGVTLDMLCNPDPDGNPTTQDRHPLYNTMPHLCQPGQAGYPYPAGLSSWTTRATDGGGNVVPQFSFGFCPWYTFCNFDTASGYVSPECDANDSEPWWYQFSDTYDPGNPFKEGTGSIASAPSCVDFNPDTRHFCRDARGVINDPGAFCDPRYDPDDYFRDQVDFAGLIDYTKQTKGSFIAMFTIFFNPSGGKLNDKIMGIKTLRYMADAGDNGEINNRPQAWYRTMHEKKNTVGDPMYSPTTGFEPPYQVGSGPFGGLSGGRVRPDADPFFDTTTTVNAGEDPCALYDYTNYYPGTVDNYTPGTLAYETMGKTDCGQFWYAESITKVNDAFTDIARRLFTRLAR
ncbi:MAG TPA: pilus assembly protein TadG-related protein [Aggregatilineales bacterium]|nr:hypothetical protein [Anaerolineales bacterium]HRE47747.1 pilus assembly protein TadG-related protein [Aggregatilineales bacterium]